MRYAPVDFSDLPGWADDDHAAAFKAFQISASLLINAETSEFAHAAAAANVNHATARDFFENNFTPHKVLDTSKPGQLTGYFEPAIAASRTRTAEFPVPLHRRPPGLVNLVADNARGAVPSDTPTHMRQTASGLVAMPCRREIDSGALQHDDLEIFYVADIVDRFIMQVQGSACLVMQDGSRVRITYDGKTGHPYTSIGRVLIENGAISARDMTLETLIQYLKADLDRARPIIWRNESYVFFRPLMGSSTDAPHGVLDTPLYPGRSLAIDTGFHALGLPVFVTAPTLTHLTDGQPFRRLMIAHDVGSAIKGPERGDLYVGTGAAAGRDAGAINHAGNFAVLLPRAHAPVSAP